MREIRENGTTIFFVSHSPGAVSKLCDRVLVLEKGKLGFDGDVEEGIKYLHYDEGDDGRRRRGLGQGRLSSPPLALAPPVWTVGAPNSPELLLLEIRHRRRVEWKLQDCSYSVSVARGRVTGVKLATRVNLPPHWSSPLCAPARPTSSPPASSCWRSVPCWPSSPRRVRRVSLDVVRPAPAAPAGPGRPRPSIPARLQPGHRCPPRRSSPSVDRGTRSPRRAGRARAPGRPDRGRRARCTEHPGAERAAARRRGTARSASPGPTTSRSPTTRSRCRSGPPPAARGPAGASWSTTTSTPPTRAPRRRRHPPGHRPAVRRRGRPGPGARRRRGRAAGRHVPGRRRARHGRRAETETPAAGDTASRDARSAAATTTDAGDAGGGDRRSRRPRHGPPADDLHPRAVGRQRAAPRRAAALRLDQRRLRAPHRQRQRLLARRGAGHPAQHLRLPHPVPRLERHRLQLPRRPVRPDLGGPLRRRRPPVVGAHTLGYNDDSFAMSAIGNFDVVQPPEAMLQAYGALFAWKLGLPGVDPRRRRSRSAATPSRRSTATATPAPPPARASTSTPRSRPSGRTPPRADAARPDRRRRRRDRDAAASRLRPGRAPYPDLVVRRASDGRGMVLPTGGLTGFARRPRSRRLGTRSTSWPPRPHRRRRDDLVVRQPSRACSDPPRRRQRHVRGRLQGHTRLPRPRPHDRRRRPRRRRPRRPRRPPKGRLVACWAREGRLPRGRLGKGMGGYGPVIGAGDVTGDGDADLLGRDGRALWLLPGTGDGRFGARTAVPGSLERRQPRSSAALDYTGDGRSRPGGPRAARERSSCCPREATAPSAARSGPATTSRSLGR